MDVHPHSSPLVTVSSGRTVVKPYDSPMRVILIMRVSARTECSNVKTGQSPTVRVAVVGQGGRRAWNGSRGTAQQHMSICIEQSRHRDDVRKAESCLLS